jgi:hypothetical protein
MKQSLVDMLLAYKESNSKKDFDVFPEDVRKEIQEFLDKDPMNKGVPFKVIESILKKAKASDEDMQKLADAFTKAVKEQFSVWGVLPDNLEITVKVKS